MVAVGALLGALALATPGAACTLWAAAGSRVEGGGTLIAKNRDWAPDCRQEGVLYRPTDGYRHYGLYAECSRTRGLMAGINEMGLVVVSASSPHRQAERLAMPAVKGLNRRLLTACASVDEALAHPDWLLGPRQMLLADRTTIALVEVGEDGVHGVRTTADGTLAVTNHYTLPETVRFNPNGEGEERGAGSRERLARIQAFLAGRLAFTLADFLAIAASREGGPDRAIFRTGHTPTSRRTLATFAVHQGPQGGELCLKLVDPAAPAGYHEERWNLDELFAAGR